MKTITENRFIELIKKCHLLIRKQEGVKIQLENYWKNEELSPLMAMFFVYQEDNRKEYIKIYLNKRDKRVDVYLFARGNYLGVNKSNKKEFRDLLVRSFIDFEEFQEYFINLIENIKGIEVKQ